VQLPSDTSGVLYSSSSCVLVLECENYTVTLKRPKRGHGRLKISTFVQLFGEVCLNSEAAVQYVSLVVCVKCFLVETD